MFNLTEAVGATLDAKNQLIPTIRKINAFPISPNNCCGAIIQTDSGWRWAKRGTKKRDFDAPYFWTHTMGIRVFPGKVEDNLPMFKGEERVEIPFKNDTLTLTYVKDYVPFETEAESDPKRGAGGLKEVANTITLINTNLIQNLCFPIFNYVQEVSDPYLTVPTLVKEYGYSQQKAEAYVALSTTRFSCIKDIHNKGTPLFFIVTTEQESKLFNHLKKYGMDSSVIFHKPKLHNMNYALGDNPRLTIVVVKGKE